MRLKAFLTPCLYIIALVPLFCSTAVWAENLNEPPNKPMAILELQNFWPPVNQYQLQWISSDAFTVALPTADKESEDLEESKASGQQSLVLESGYELNLNFERMEIKSATLLFSGPSIELIVPKLRVPKSPFDVLCQNLRLKWTANRFEVALPMWLPSRLNYDSLTKRMAVQLPQQQLKLWLAGQLQSQFTADSWRTNWKLENNCGFLATGAVNSAIREAVLSLGAKLSERPLQVEVIDAPFLQFKNSLEVMLLSLLEEHIAPVERLGPLLHDYRLIWQQMPDSWTFLLYQTPLASGHWRLLEQDRRRARPDLDVYLAMNEAFVNQALSLSYSRVAHLLDFSLDLNIEAWHLQDYFAELVNLDPSEALVLKIQALSKKDALERLNYFPPLAKLWSNSSGQSKHGLDMKSALKLSLHKRGEEEILWERYVILETSFSLASADDPFSRVSFEGGRWGWEDQDLEQSPYGASGIAPLSPELAMLLNWMLESRNPAAEAFIKGHIEESLPEPLKQGLHWNSRVLLPEWRVPEARRYGYGHLGQAIVVEWKAPQ